MNDVDDVLQVQSLQYEGVYDMASVGGHVDGALWGVVVLVRLLGNGTWSASALLPVYLKSEGRRT